MVVSCSAWGCKNRFSREGRRRGLTFHRFPAEKKLRRQWEVALRRKDWKATRNSSLCSDHFKADDLYRAGEADFVRLRKGAVPSVFSFSPHPQRAVKSLIAQTSKDTEESLSVTGPPQQQCQETNTHNVVSICYIQSSSGHQQVLIGPEIVCPAPHPPQPPERDLKAPPSTHITKDHSYALPGTLDGLKAKLMDAMATAKSLKQDLRNSKSREQLAKKKVTNLLEDVRERNVLNEELKARLDYYSDVPMELLSKQGHEYTKDQKEFAHTLHRLGPRAYDYLRDKLHLTLPHPHTLQRWSLEERAIVDKPELDQAMVEKPELDQAMVEKPELDKAMVEKPELERAIDDILQSSLEEEEPESWAAPLD